MLMPSMKVRWAKKKSSSTGITEMARLVHLSWEYRAGASSKQEGVDNAATALYPASGLLNEETAASRSQTSDGWRRRSVFVPASVGVFLRRGRGPFRVSTGTLLYRTE